MSLDQALNIDDHYSDLLEDFFDVRNKWETFGLRLGLTDATLESFQGDDEEKFRMVLKTPSREQTRFTHSHHPLPHAECTEIKGSWSHTAG